MKREGFRFLDPGILSDGELSLVLTRCLEPDPGQGKVAAYDFEIHAAGVGEAVGAIGFRVGNTLPIELYRGHIGYNVLAHHRGRHYAERAVRLLLPFIRRHGFATVWITCNPDNIPSRRTCERLGAKMIEIVPLPPTEEMYGRGEREKCRYRLDL